MESAPLSGSYRIQSSGFRESSFERTKAETQDSQSVSDIPSVVVDISAQARQIAGSSVNLESSPATDSVENQSSAQKVAQERIDETRRAAASSEPTVPPAVSAALASYKKVFERA